MFDFLDVINSTFGLTQSENLCAIILVSCFVFILHFHQIDRCMCFHFQYRISTKSFSCETIASLTRSVTMNMEIKPSGHTVDVWAGWGESIRGYFEKEC